MTTQAGVAVRVIATRVVDAVMHRGRSLKAELAANLPRIEDARDRALLEAICFAVLRSRARGEAAIAAWMSKPPGPGDSDLRALLHVGFAQLVVMALPAHAALSATVEAVRALGRPHQDKLVNALLRRAQREGLPAVAADAAWPAWLRRHVRADWPEHADAIFAASQCEAPLWLRVNRRHGTREAYLRRLQDAGIAAERAEGAADAVLLRTPVAATTLPGFADGHVSVQDGAAQRVADLFLDLPAGARVLDLCAAPGGKSAHLLERDPSLQLVALDIDARRLQRVRETLDRVGVSARLQAADGADPASWWDGQPFDAVLRPVPPRVSSVASRMSCCTAVRRTSWR